MVNLVNGAKEVIDALLDHPTVRGVSFVGATPTAKHIYARAAANGKRVQAQGGAKNHLVVMPDAVLDACLSNLLGSCFGAAGQRCLAGSVILTVGDAHDRFMEQFVDTASSIVVGNGLEASVDLGPVVSARARARILEYIESGLAEGARLALDGRDLRVVNNEPGFFIGPTIFDDVTPTMRIAQEEIFGPVISVIRVADLDEAIEVIERSPYGNAASIYTQNGAAARTFRYQVNCGNIGINGGVAAPMAYFPFSGFKQSFFGTQHGQGRDAIDFFTDRKVVIERWL